MSEANDEGRPGLLSRLFGAGAEWLGKRHAGEGQKTRLRAVLMKSGDRHDGEVLEATAFTIVLKTDVGVLRIPREDVAKVVEPSALLADAGRSATAGRPGDEGTITFGKKGPREYKFGDVRADAERLEEERARAQSAEHMTELRARCLAAFLNPAPRTERDLADRALTLDLMVRNVLESEGVDAATLSKAAWLDARSRVKAEAIAMRSAKLLASVAPPDEHKIWEASPDTYTLTYSRAVSRLTAVRP